MHRSGLLVWLVSALRVAAQWEVPGPIILDGMEPEQRQVTGLATPDHATDGITMDADRYRRTNSGPALGVNDITVVLVPPIAAYTPGLRVTVFPSVTNTGSVTLDLNGLGSVPVRKALTLPLDSGDLRPGLPVDLIYDGNVFQVGNQLYPACPPGFKALGREACVEAESHDPVNWFTAGLRCADRGLRLCSFSEWMRACLQEGGILGTVSDYEWVDSAANSTNLAKTMGLNELTALPDCQGGGHKLPTQTSRYRCCSDR